MKFLQKYLKNVEKHVFNFWNLKALLRPQTLIDLKEKKRVFRPFSGRSHRDDYPIPRKGRPLFFAYKTWSFLPAAGLQKSKILFY